ncbi:hypothetical protein [uncultured Methylibium sp.]|uniref:hypothetical protein n=1 Tax=uncultured Methylibium sp. TaxID=381093 RepID=UPI0025E4A1D3|nr:hypothetical protein [uncultured Methylibium sp.]
MNTLPLARRRRPLLQWLAVALLAAALPLQGLAVGMASVSAPAHFHVDDGDRLDVYFGDDEPAHPHAAVGHHGHELGDPGVVYVAASQDGDAGGGSVLKNPPTGLEATGLAAGVPALPHAVPERPLASCAGFLSRVVAPLEHPPR